MGVDEPTRNRRIFVDVVTGADAVITVGDDQRCSGSRTDKQDWGELLAPGAFRQCEDLLNPIVVLGVEVHGHLLRTVDTHRAHIMRKLHLETRAALVLFAPANGLIGAT